MALTFDAKKNFAFSVVATAPSPATSGTSLIVAPGDGTKFPTPPFNAVIWPPSVQPTAANAEVVRVTAISTDTLTITRAQELSSARTVVINDQIALNVTAKTLTDIEAAFVTAGTTYAPVGAVALWLTNTAPTGWLFLRGQAISRATYSELFALWGTYYGNGDNVTTFNVPDMMRRIPIGQATSGAVSTLGELLGSWDHTHGVGTLTVASHTHGPGTLTVASHTHDSGTLQVASHTHGPGTLQVASHSHTSGSYTTDTANLAHTHTFSATTGAPSAGGTASSGVGTSIATASHTHDVSGTTDSSLTTHSHSVTGGSSGTTSPLVDSGVTASTAPAVTSGNTGGTAPSVTGGVTAGTAPAVSTGVTAASNPPVLALNFIVRAVSAL